MKQQSQWAKRAEGQKRSKWRVLAETLDATVVPLAFETTGHRGAAIGVFLREMEEASNVGPSRLELYNQLSATLQKLNVEMCREAGRKAVGIRRCKRRFMHARLR